MHESSLFISKPGFGTHASVPSSFSPSSATSLRFQHLVADGWKGRYSLGFPSPVSSNGFGCNPFPFTRLRAPMWKRRRRRGCDKTKRFVTATSILSINQHIFSLSFSFIRVLARAKKEVNDRLTVPFLSFDCRSLLPSSLLFPRARERQSEEDKCRTG